MRVYQYEPPGHGPTLSLKVETSIGRIGLGPAATAAGHISVA